MFVALLALGCLIARGAAQTPAVKAFTGARLFNSATGATVDNTTLVVRDGRIVSAGPAAGITIPAGAERIALTGKTIVPGLVNTHGHVNNAERDLRTYAAYGVTTIVSLGGETAPTFAVRNAQGTASYARTGTKPTGSLDRARVIVSGAVLEPKTVEEARKLVADNVASGADWIKIRVDDTLGTTEKMKPEVYRAVIDEAHKRGRRVAAHLFYLADAKGLVDAGADMLAHSVRDAEVDAAFLAALKAKGSNICLVPTLMREVSTFVYESTPTFFSDPLFLKHADMQQVNRLKQPKEQEAMKNSPQAQRYKQALEVASRNLKRLSDAGVIIGMGTDTGPAGRFQGYFEQMELELMVKAGLTPRQALIAATRDAARCGRIDQEVGTLEANKAADFVILDGDPLADIANIRRISDVYVAGNRVAR